jgi:hypothetical protein
LMNYTRQERRYSLIQPKVNIFIENSYTDTLF